MTLRALAKEAGVTPAFLSDLEKNRRNTERLDKFSAALGVPVEELRELDGRVPIELKEWLQANPSLLALLRELRASGRPVPVDALRASLRLSRG
jgi:transcriptional regulator with XRE-family HTH domain